MYVLVHLILRFQFLHFSSFFFLLHKYIPRATLFDHKSCDTFVRSHRLSSVLFRPFKYGRPCIKYNYCDTFCISPLFSCFYRPRATLFDCKGRDTSVRSRGHGPGFAQEDLFQCLQASFNHRQNPTEDGTHFKPDIPWSCL